MAVDAEQTDANPTMITPGVCIKDPHAAYWFAQVALRLRREVAWCWHQRMQQPAIEGALAPVTDAAVESLDLVRYLSQKQAFFRNDTAARFLSEQIAALTSPGPGTGAWQQISTRLQLASAAEFVLVLGFAAQVDAALAPVFSSCLNDQSRPFSTLALAQRLWGEPQEIIGCADPNHDLFRYGLLRPLDAGGGHVWQRALDMPATVVQQLIDPSAPLPAGIEACEVERARTLDDNAELLVSRLRSNDAQMQVVPLLGPKGAAFSDWAASLGRALGRPVVSVDAHLLFDQNDVLPTASICWLREVDISLTEQWSLGEKWKEHSELLLAAQGIPLRWYVPIDDSDQISSFPPALLTPALHLPSLDFAQRMAAFDEQLGAASTSARAGIEKCARRFRFQEKTIARVAQTFRSRNVALTQEKLRTACANEAEVELGNLAQLVSARFRAQELVLPAKQAQQFKEILHAMRALTVVHHHWGTAKVWNESGLSALFCGPPGTGKTMAAEVIACTLQIPMFRIDLSQVVNKYIGVTEKNLKRIFDAAELSDCILFFDEADALFGKRTDVKDSHDRFANIEISYLLERMERFKGLAILATNRRKDLDEAFMRRLRFVIEFSVPDVEERTRIWQLVFPNIVDTEELDIRYLARQFQLSGGNIRSVAFNACLRAANATVPEAEAKVTMVDVLMAVKRELEKTNRVASGEVFGRYEHLVEHQA